VTVVSEPLASFLASARTLVDDALERWLPKPPPCPAIVSDAMRYSVFAGGKRLRPALVLAAADAVARRGPDGAALGGHRGPERAAPHAGADAAPGVRVADVAQGFSPAILLALPAACAIEMIHTYSLIHDDLPAMDNDTLRRGRATLHVVYGDGIAVLAGDGLHAEAFALLACEPASTDAGMVTRKLRTIQIVGEAAGVTGMVGGQAIDLQAAGQAPGHRVTLDADGLRAMHTRKTGALIRASAMSGAVMAGADEDLVCAVDRYASEIGLAFQIVDDILDVEGDAEALGKSAGKDAASDKPTYPKLFGLERSRAMAKDCLARAHGALAGAGLDATHLAAIADWIVTRRN
jgi:geranylgeranyl pyrophosphate synthase